MRILLVPAILLFAFLAYWVPERSQPHDSRIHLTYWEKWTGFEGDAMRAVVDAFNRSQDKITVDMLTVSQVDQKLLLATAGGVPPDVAGLWSYNVNVFADKGALLPLDDYMRGAGYGPSYYLPVYWKVVDYRGHVWAVPSTPATTALHWNRTLFREAGLDPDRPPRTIEELDRYADRLTKRDAKGNLIQAGFMHSEPGWWNWAWGYFFGGKLWDGKSKITAASPENIRAFKWVQSYAKKYGTSQLQVFKSGFGSFSSPQNAFLSRPPRVAMVLQGVWMHNFIHKYSPTTDWAAAPFPYPADRPDLANTTVAEEDVLVIPRGSKHPDEAFEFLKYANSQKGMELLCLGHRKNSPLTHVSADFYRKHENPYIRVFGDLARSPNAFGTPQIGIWTEYRDELNSAFDNIWLMKKTPEQALKEVQVRMQAKLDRELARRKYREGDAAVALGGTRP
ncbi:MAG TPA: ABC transporter substrate-binding protein [Armatimonadota bacterium]